jgi:hypothetical protein
MAISDAGNNWLGGVAEALVPGVGSQQDRERTDAALRKQNEAGEKAIGYAKEGLDYVRTQNEPLIALGDRQLQALKSGVEGGLFDMNEGIFSLYQQHVVPQYEQGGMFQYEQRKNIVTPEKFQYAQANPEQFRYEQQAPTAYGQQQNTQQQQGGSSSSYRDSLDPQTRASFDRLPASEQAKYFNPDNMQGQPYNEEYAKTLTPEQRNQYNQQQFGQVQGDKFVPNQPQGNQQFQGGQQPQQIQNLQYRDFQSEQQAPKFQPQQNFGQQPQQYRAQDAPQGQYVQPQQQYQGKQFRLEDDPVYQRRLADSNKAIEASAAARGMQLSGSNLKALQQNAGELAAQEGDAAFNRFQQQDQTEYGRFQDQRTDLKDTTRYQTEDQYRRFLDSQNIKGTEADKAIAQWNTDRQFNQGANVQNFQTSQDAYAQNRGQDADIYNMNAGNQLAYNAQNFGQFDTNRGFDRSTQAQNFDQYMQGRQQAQGENQQNYGQFADQRDFAANQYQQGVNNQLDYYNVNNANFTGDRSFDYGVNQDAEAARRGNYEFQTNLDLAQDAQKYGQLTDSYNRQATNKQNKYGMISDLANVGMTARQQNADATTGYYGAISDIGMQQANAAAAAAQSKNDNNGLLSFLGL